MLHTNTLLYESLISLQSCFGIRPIASRFSYAVFFVCSGFTLMEFREPVSGCTGTLSAGESSHAKDRDQSPFKVRSGQGSVPKKNLLRQLEDGDTGISTPAA